jgi:hypothetical protein
MPKTAQQLADELTPQVRETLGRYHDAFVRNAGHLLRREAAIILWPTLMAEVNTGLVFTLDLVLSRFGQMTVADMITLVVDHTKSKGLQPHSSYSHLEKNMNANQAGPDRGIVDRILDRSIIAGQEHLESNPDLAPGTYGSGAPVAAMAGFLPGVSTVLLDFFVQFGEPFLVKHEQVIADFIGKQSAMVIQMLADKLKSLHAGK